MSSLHYVASKFFLPRSITPLFHISNSIRVIGSEERKFWSKIVTIAERNEPYQVSAVLADKKRCSTSTKTVLFAPVIVGISQSEKTCAPVHLCTGAQVHQCSRGALAPVALENAWKGKHICQSGQCRALYSIFSVE
jgi:hypothetical protein